VSTPGCTPGGEALGRTLYDIARLLESAEDPVARVAQVLERLRSLVPYERCALLAALPGSDPRLLTAPGTPARDEPSLEATITDLRGRLVAQRGRPTTTTQAAGHLAVPLVGLDEVVGVLYVRAADGVYEEQHVHALSIVAAKLAAYLTMVDASAREAQRSARLEKARDAAEVANRAKDEFLAVVSHELRTPLTTILIWADALRTAAGGDEREQAFAAIERSVRGQAKLIDDLLDLSCVAAATLRLDLRAVEPARLIEAAIRELQPRATRKSIRLEAVLDESVSPLVADPHRLSQIVTNLVGNAIKFTPEGGQVAVHLERSGAGVHIRVIDSGAGISPDLLPGLFEPFRRGDGSTTRDHGGLGMGLALVKDLVELHGGRVRAESPGRSLGSTFTVELPLAGADVADTQDARTLAGVRVLVVDDNPDICDVLRLVLEAQGAVVAVAGSAREALAALEPATTDVLLSDIAMPGESGYDLMRRIVARDGAGAVPAAALSAYAPRHDPRQALDAGFRVQLAKPCEPNVLIATVAALAGRTAVAPRTSRWSP
jgi:signal transduction histidine kinase/CheY-like chemotaxis protein